MGRVSSFWVIAVVMIIAALVILSGVSEAHRGLPGVTLTPSAPMWERSYHGDSNSEEMRNAALTVEGGLYSAARAGGSLAVANSAGVGGNTRQLYWPPNMAPAVNSRSCADFAVDTQEGKTPLQQQGLAVRIRNQDGRVRAITVTKNVVYDIGWFFNAHTWDTSRSDAPFVGLGQWDMGAVVAPYGYAPLPWRACLQVIDQFLAFKIWVPATTSEPGWDNARHVRTALIPAEFVYAGQSGWYAGHLVSNGAVSYRNMGIWKYQ